MKLQGKRRAVLLGLALLLLGGTGCRYLRELWRSTCAGITIGPSGVRMTVCPGRCPCAPGPTGGEIAQVPADYRSAPTAWTTLARAVDNGTAVEAAGECSLVCSPEFGGDPDSADCDSCRTAVGAAMVTPFFSLCAGSVFTLPPDRVLGVIRARTDVGEFQSEIIWAFKRPGSVRYDDCGSVNRADYDLDSRPTQQFTSYIISRGAQQLLRTEFEQVGVGGPGNSQPLIALRPEIRQLLLEGKTDGISDVDMVLRASAWPFQAGGADPVLGPGQFDGAIMTPTVGPSAEDLAILARVGEFSFSSDARGGLKPCSSDGDCSRWGLVCRPSDVGLVCVAP